MAGVGFFDYLVQTFTERLPFFPKNIRASLFIILFCAITLLELYLYILVKRVDQYKKEVQRKKWESQVHDLLANMVIHDDSETIQDTVDYFYEQFKELAHKNKWVKNTLTREILIYHRNFTGRTAEILSIMYIKLGFDRQTFKKIKSRSWEVKIDGVREARQMNLIENANAILAYTDDENALLRMEAQAAFIRLAPQNPFRFLDRAQERILDWHQVVLFDVITKSKNITTPSFKQWLYSPNHTVVVLCLNLISHYMQFDAVDEMIRLLKHQHTQVRSLAIKTLGKFEAEDAEKALFEIYFDESEDLQIDVLMAFGRIASGNFTAFLKSRLFSPDQRIKMAALRALKSYPDPTHQELHNLYKETTLQNRKLIEHILDDRIRA